MTKTIILFIAILLMSGCSTYVPKKLDQERSVYMEKAAKQQYSEQFSNEQLLLKNKIVKDRNVNGKAEFVEGNHFYKATNEKTGREELILKGVTWHQQDGPDSYIMYDAPVNIDLGLDYIESVKQFSITGKDNSGVYTATLFKGRASGCGTKQAWSYLWFDSWRKLEVSKPFNSFFHHWKTFENGGVICTEHEPKIFLSDDKRQIVMFDEKEYKQSSAVALIDIPTSSYKITTMLHVKENQFAGIKKYRYTLPGEVVEGAPQPNEFEILQKIDVDDGTASKQPVADSEEILTIDLIK